MLHIGVESVANPAVPGWFREGLVLHLAGDHSGAALSREAAAYRDAQSRVEALVRTHGRATVLGWLQSGLPRRQ
jgi:hypothetical protein